MSVPVYKIVLDGIDGGTDEEVLAGFGAFGARAAYAHFVNEPLCHLRGGEPAIWVTLFQLEHDGWVLVDLSPVNRDITDGIVLGRDERPWCDL